MGELLPIDNCLCKVVKPNGTSPNELYRVSKELNTSESMAVQTGGRHTGFFGTGVYFFRTLDGASSYQERRQENLKIIACNKPERPYEMDDDIMLRLHDFSKVLVGMSLIKLRIRWSQESARKTMPEELDKLKSDLREVSDKLDTFYLPRLGVDRKLADKCTDEVATSLASKSPYGEGWDKVSQPLNCYLQAHGYDGILVKPGGRLDNSGYGSVYFSEDFKKRCDLLSHPDTH